MSQGQCFVKYLLLFPAAFLIGSMGNCLAEEKTQEKVPLEEKDPSWRDLLSHRKKEKSDYRLHFTRGFLNQEEGDYKKAIGHYEEAIKFKADCAQAYLYRGYCEDKLGKTKDALASYRKALGLKSDLKEGYLFLGRAYLKRYRIDDARKQLKKLKDLDAKMAAEFEKAINEKAKP